MKMTSMKTLSLCIGLLGFVGLFSGPNALADQLVYTPVNPTFGGNPLNASGLLAIANAQNQTKAPVVQPDTPLEKFQNQLQNAILGRIQTNVLSDLFDSKTIDFSKPKTYVAGDYVITIQQNADKTVTMTTSDKTIPGSGTTINLGNITNLAVGSP